MRRRAAAVGGGGGTGDDDNDISDNDAAAAAPAATAPAAARAAPVPDESFTMGQLGQPPRPPPQLVAITAAPLSPGHAQLLALLRAVDRDDPSGAGGGLAALDDSIAMGQPHSPAAAGAPPPPPAALGPLAQLILDAAAAAAGDAPLDADDELAFNGTAAAAADAAVELTGGDGHPPPDDWALAALGSGNVGAAGDDCATPATAATPRPPRASRRRCWSCRR